VGAEGLLLQPGLGHLGQDHAGPHRIDPDALGRHFAGKALGEGIDRPFAGGIGRRAQASAQRRRHRRDVDDRAAPAAASGRHAPGRFAAAQHQPRDIGGEQIGQYRGVVFVDPAAATVDAGTVDQVRDRPQGALGLLEQPDDVGLVRHVARQCDGPATLRLDVGNDRFGLGVAAPVVDRDLVAAGTRATGGLGADARGAAGDQKGFAHVPMI